MGWCNSYREMRQAPLTAKCKSASVLLLCISLQARSCILYNIIRVEILFLVRKVSQVMGEDEGNTSFALFAWGFLFIGFSNISLVLQ